MRNAKVLGTILAFYHGIGHNFLNIEYNMKKLFVSALMLTGVVAMAQEPAKQATTQQQPQTQQQPAQQAPAQQAKPAAEVQTQAQQAKPAANAQKPEATVRNDKAEAKKADPAKKSK